MICNCGNSGAAKKAIGYHRREDGMWTHALCDRPSKLYLKGHIERMPMTHLNLLQGGPLHNTFLSNAELLDRVAISLKDNGDFVLQNVDRYRWTDETVTGQSGKVARIWRYKED